MLEYDGTILVIEEYQNLGISDTIILSSVIEIYEKYDFKVSKLLMSKTQLATVCRWSLNVCEHESHLFLKTEEVQNKLSKKSLDYVMANRSSLTVNPPLIVLVLSKVGSLLDVQSLS